MIEDILKDRKPDQKPRFFLHEELKAWLADNLTMSISSGRNLSINSELASKLNLHHDKLTVGHWMNISVELDGETILHQGVNLPQSDHDKAFQTIANVCEQCMVAITKLQAENEQLKKRIELLENPLPL